MMSARSNALNKNVLAYLKARKPDEAPFASPASHSDPYWKLGSRPDEVTLVWDELGSQLPRDCRSIVHGTPGLVHPASGVVFALALGSVTAMRMPQPPSDAALPPGCRIVEQWSNGGSLNIQDAFGRDWVFGINGPLLIQMYDKLERLCE